MKYAILDRMDGTPALMASLLYGSGMRLLECCRLRVKDVELERLALRNRAGKGAKDRVTVLPETLAGPLADPSNGCAGRTSATSAAVPASSSYPSP